MPQPKSARWWVWFAVLAVVGPRQTIADPGGECPVPAQPIPGFQAIADGDTDISPPMRMRADSVEVRPDGVVVLSGNVELQRQDQRVLAEEIIYDRAEAEVDARGNVTVENVEGDQVRAEEVYLDLDEFRGYATAGTYRIGRNEGRGDAESIELESKERLHLNKVRYTTCPPGKDDWFFSLGELTLDKSRNLGTARNAVVRFKRVPIFYWPYVRFPISDERQTGFLFPELGRSTKSGIEFGWPFYWNIAPNYDATITPRILTDRGLQAQTEFRYLGRPFRGELDTEFLLDDDQTGTDRWAVRYTHHNSFGHRWAGDINYAKVSDDAYLDDFQNNLGITSLTHLPQEAFVTYADKTWDFRARALAFQTIDPTIALDDRPYDRVPQLTLAAHPPSRPGRPGLLFGSEFNNFQREQSLEGARLNLELGVDWPFRKSYGYVIPKVAFASIGYDLDVDAPQDQTPGVTVPLFSLDNGLIFEREANIRGGRFIQTLEPRLFYLYRPFEDQDDLPNFDTSLPDLSFANLFRENRFVGGDRISDANQATLALTTRLIGADDGAERLRFSIGQIFHFEDRKVNLTSGTIETRETSDLVAELTARFAEKWFGRATLQWNNDSRDTEQSNLFIQYQPVPDRIVNFRYSFARDDFEQLDLSTQWPVGRRWTVTASTSYSLEDQRNLQTYGGFEYRSCCWALRFFARRRLDAQQEQVNDVLFQFEFTGLGRLGSIPDSPLKQSVFVQ
ncbi:MAG: LPS-assembly protein LptD [Acidiferrobacterales bacterium]